MKKIVLALTLLAAGVVPARAGIYYDLQQTASSATMKLAGVLHFKDKAASTAAADTVTVETSSGVVTAKSFIGAVTGAASLNVLKTGDTMSGPLTMAGSSITITGNAFSVGGSTFVVNGGVVGIGLNPTSALAGAVSPLQIVAPGNTTGIAIGTTTATASFTLNPQTAGGWTIGASSANTTVSTVLSANNGIMSMPTQSSVMAHQSVGTTIPANSVWTKIAFNTVEKDAQNEYSTAQASFTAKIAGDYQVNARCYFYSSVVAGSAYHLAIYKNGSSYHEIQEVAVNTGGFDLSISDAINLAAGDTISIWALDQDAATAASCYSATLPYFSHFSVVKVN